MVRMSAPRCNACVAKLCRNVWLDTRLAIPKRLTAALIALLIVEVDVAPDPVTVAALGVDGIMLEPHHLADLVEQFQFGIGNNPLRGGR